MALQANHCSILHNSACRRLPDHVRSSAPVIAAGLQDTLYQGDLEHVAQAVGFLDPRTLSSQRLEFPDVAAPAPGAAQPMHAAPQPTHADAGDQHVFAHMYDSFAGGGAGPGLSSRTSQPDSFPYSAPRPLEAFTRAEVEAMHAQGGPQQGQQVQAHPWPPLA